MSLALEHSTVYNRKKRACTGRYVGVCTPNTQCFSLDAFALSCLLHIHLRTVAHTYRMAGKFGGKIFWRIAENLAEFTLAVEPGLAIMIFITKWLLKRAGILIVFTGPRTRRLDRLRRLDRQANSSPTSGVQNSLEK